MSIATRLRNLELTAHVISTVGWVGAVVAFLPFTVTSLTSQDAQVVSVDYLMLEPATQLVFIPTILAS